MSSSKCVISKLPIRKATVVFTAIYPKPQNFCVTWKISQKSTLASRFLVWYEYPNILCKTIPKTFYWECDSCLDVCKIEAPKFAWFGNRIFYWLDFFSSTFRQWICNSKSQNKFLSILLPDDPKPLPAFPLRKIIWHKFCN